MKQANLITTNVAVCVRVVCGLLVNEEALSELWKAVNAMRLNFFQNAFCGRIFYLWKTTSNAITWHNCPCAYRIYLGGIAGIMIMDGEPRSTSKRHKVFWENAILAVI